MPENSHLFAAFGSAISADTTKVSDFETLIAHLGKKNILSAEIARLMFFHNKEEYDQFTKRHEGISA